VIVFKIAAKARMFWLLFFRGKIFVIIICQKTDWATFWTDFFTNASGHLERLSTSMHLLSDMIHHERKYFLVKACLQIRVARWHIFKPKIPIWAHFGKCKMELTVKLVRHGHETKCQILST
jgi:hypothetical protein